MFVFIQLPMSLMIESTNNFQRQLKQLSLWPADHCRSFQSFNAITFPGSVLPHRLSLLHNSGLRSSSSWLLQLILFTVPSATVPSPLVSDIRVGAHNSTKSQSQVQLFFQDLQNSLVLGNISLVVFKSSKTQACYFSVKYYCNSHQVYMGDHRLQITTGNHSHPLISNISQSRQFPE